MRPESGFAIDQNDLVDILDVGVLSAIENCMYMLKFLSH